MRNTILTPLFKICGVCKWLQRYHNNLNVYTMCILWHVYTVVNSLYLTWGVRLIGVSFICELIVYVYTVQQNASSHGCNFGGVGGGELRFLPVKNVWGYWAPHTTPLYCFGWSSNTHIVSTYWSSSSQYSWIFFFWEIKENLLKFISPK